VNWLDEDGNRRRTAGLVRSEGDVLIEHQDRFREESSAAA